MSKKQAILSQSHLKDLYDEIDQKETQDILNNPETVNKIKFLNIENEDFSEKKKSKGEFSKDKKHSFDPLSKLFGKKEVKVNRLRTQSENPPTKDQVEIQQNYHEVVLKEYSMCSNQKNV